VVEAMQHSGEKIHYLSLALDARLAIKALRQKSSLGAVAPQLRASVKAALDSLKAINRGGELYARLGELEPYEHFELLPTRRHLNNSATISSRLERKRASTLARFLLRLNRSVKRRRTLEALPVSLPRSSQLGNNCTPT
jgi:hypothetical protein